eukprot:m.82214 g.82214  ORF g.82214 m.82214 type:complete len:88 (-) comp50772_c0_seq3:1512-1775(-)
MPRHSKDEFRSANKFGHRSRSDSKQRNRSSSPPARLPNTNKGSPKCCSFCSPGVHIRVANTLQIHRTMRADLADLASDAFVDDDETF